MPIKSLYFNSTFDVDEGDVLFSLSCIPYYHASIIIEKIYNVNENSQIKTIGFGYLKMKKTFDIEEEDIIGKNPQLTSDNRFDITSNADQILSLWATRDKRKNEI